jgi:hypothetical protein
MTTTVNKATSTDVKCMDCKYWYKVGSITGVCIKNQSFINGKKVECKTLYDDTCEKAVKEYRRLV